MDICEANRKEIIIIKTNSGFRIDDLHDDLGISIRESREASESRTIFLIPWGAEILSRGKDAKTRYDSSASQNTFFSFTSAISLSRVLLARSGMGNWRETDARQRGSASAVYPPRTKDGSITHAFCVPMITRRRERPVRFSEPSIAFTSYFTHPRMVNFVQSWQRVSADRPIAVGRPSRAFEMKLKTRARWILFVLREDWRKNAARRQFESNRASNRIFLSLFVFNCVFTYINTYLFHFENFYIPFSIYFIISLYMYIICFKK